MNVEQAAATDRVPLVIRAMRPDETPFVASNWLRNYSDSPWAKKMSQTDYYEGHSKLVNALIERATVLVAEHETEGALLGFACGERTEHVSCLHYVLVKGYARGNGIANTLVESLLKRIGGKRIVCTHRRAPATEIMARRGWAYTPYPLWKIVK